MPRPVRVWEFAAELFVTSAEVLEALRGRGEWATSHLSAVPEVHLTDLRHALTVRDRDEHHAPGPAGRRGPGAPIPVPPASRGTRPPPSPDARPRPPWPRPNSFAQPGRRPRRRPGPAPVTYQRPPEPYYEDDDYAYYSDPLEDLRHEPVMSTRDVADLCGITPAGVRQWVTRGHLTPIDTDGPSHIFNTRDVLAAERAIVARSRHLGLGATPVPLRPAGGPLRPSDLGGVNRPPGRHTAADLARLMRVYPNLVLDTAQAAALLGLKTATIRSWVHRGRLTPIPTPDKPTPDTPAGASRAARRRYRLTDVLRAAGIHTS
jgi:DNA-binding transcriptional MerR regulator